MQARLVDAIVNYDGSTAATAALPAKLSQTGLYDKVASNKRAVTAGIVPYEVNSALWSDGAHKSRWISIPSGTTITPTDSDHYTFPEKTVLIKNFALDTIQGDSTSRIIIETRFLIFNKGATFNNYRGVTYSWSRDQSDAELVPSLGLNRVFAIKMGSKFVGKRWGYPGRAVCQQCHAGRGVLGFVTPQLNRASKSNAAVNQLADLVTKGILSKNPLTASPNSVKWVAVDDANASLELRARSWLAANCSHCHGNGNKMNLSMFHDFDYFNKAQAFKFDSTIADLDQQEKQPGYVGRHSKTDFGGEYPYVMQAGHPEISLAIKRMITRGSPEAPLDNPYDQMPWIATYVPDSTGVRAVADWLCQLGQKPTGAACKIPDVTEPPPPDVALRLARHARLMTGQTGIVAFIADGHLYLQAPLKGGASPAAAPVLTDISGKAIALAPDGKDIYALPAGLSPGAYYVHWRGETISVSAGM